MTSDIKPVLAAMEGDGFYNRHSSLQAAGIASVLPLWQKVAESVEIDDGPLVVADYGSSQGRNPMALIRRCATFSGPRRACRRIGFLHLSAQDSGADGRSRQHPT